MRVNKRYTVAFRRKRESKTDYRKRLKLLTGGKDRLVVRASGNHFIAQLVRFDPKGDQVLAQADSRELKTMKWPFVGNLPSAYLTGYLLAQRAKKQKAGDVLLDLGMQYARAGTRLFGVLKGAVEGGLNVRHSEEVLPSDERVRGEHIAAYAASASGNQFKKVGNDAKNMTQLFEATKKQVETVN